MKKIYFLILILTFTSFSVFSQKDSSNIRIAQLTFSYPLGTNGFTSYKYSNNLSINMLLGLNGGVNGCEFAGIGNMNNGNINGAQISGMLNLTKGNINGLQTSGMLNVNHGNVTGSQISGMSNIITGNLTGIQVAGFLNFNKGNVKFLQVAGFVNSNYGTAEGLQVAGFVNSNLCQPNSKKVNLAQFSGFVNQNASQFNGTQITGFVNLSLDSMKGAQISMLNFSTYLEGVQIGLVNICTKKSTKIIPIGLISFVRGGLFELELAGGDFVYSNLNYKMGVEHFYTIYKIGYTVFDNKSFYSYGLGFGSYIKLNDKNRLSIEYSTSNVTNYFLVPTSYDLLSKIDLNYKRQLNKHFSYFIGVSFNTLVADNYHYQEKPILKPLYHISKNSYSYFDLYNWFGLNMGVAFKL